MSKVIKAINVMVSNPSLISDVYKGMHFSEIFFKYDRKHCWSILKNAESVYYLSYFPSAPDLSRLSDISDEEWEIHGPQAVTYNTKDLATKEAIESFSELFSLVNEKVFGMDNILSEIIASDEVP